LLGGVTLTASEDQTIRLWDRAGRQILVLREAAPLRQAALGPGGRELFVLVRGEWGVRVWDLAELAARLRDLGLEPGFTVADAPRVEQAREPTQGLVAELYRDRHFGFLIERRRDRQIAFDWGKGPLSPWLPSDEVSIRWTGSLRAPRPGRWELQIDVDDCASLWLDGVRFMSGVSNSPGGPHPTVAVELPARPVSFRLDYEQHSGPARCRLLWRPAGSTAPFVAVPPEAFSPERPPALKATAR
jgi:hypothetical protein